MELNYSLITAGEDSVRHYGVLWAKPSEMMILMRKDSQRGNVVMVLRLGRSSERYFVTYSTFLVGTPKSQVLSLIGKCQQLLCTGASVNIHIAYGMYESIETPS